MALKITGWTKVKTLKVDFKEEFGLSLRVYDGKSFADEESSLASIRKNDNKGGELSPQRNMKVGNFEDKLLEIFGIKTQVSGSDDSYLCEDELTLAKALEEDTKKMDRKDKKASKQSDNENSDYDEEGKETMELYGKEIVYHYENVDIALLEDYGKMGQFIEDFLDDADQERVASLIFDGVNIDSKYSTNQLVDTIEPPKNDQFTVLYHYIYNDVKYTIDCDPKIDMTINISKILDYNILKNISQKGEEEYPECDYSRTADEYFITVFHKDNVVTVNWSDILDDEDYEDDEERFGVVSEMIIDELA